jgi:hypothetical protein
MAHMQSRMRLHQRGLLNGSYFAPQLAQHPVSALPIDAPAHLAGRGRCGPHSCRRRAPPGRRCAPPPAAGPRPRALIAQASGGRNRGGQGDKGEACQSCRQGAVAKLFPTVTAAHSPRPPPNDKPHPRCATCDRAQSRPPAPSGRLRAARRRAAPRTPPQSRLQQAQGQPPNCGEQRGCRRASQRPPCTPCPARLPLGRPSSSAVHERGSIGACNRCVGRREAG